MIVYYVSGHGFGHAVRTCDILLSLTSRFPDTPVCVVSSVESEFFQNRVPSPSLRHRRGQFDVGMVQLDSVRVDVEATYEQVSKLYAREQEYIDAETRFLLSTQARLVVSDIAAIPFQAASAAHLPCIAVGNFAWDWIYTPFAKDHTGWQALVERFEQGYRCADLLVRLPFAEPMKIFTRQADVALLARPGTPDRQKVAACTGADPSKTWVLLSFSTLDLPQDAVARIGEQTDIDFFTVLPLHWEMKNIHAVNREIISFANTLASVDAVLTKPGYGILSECLVNEKPMIYVDRDDFREYPILEAAVKAHLRHAHIPAPDLYSGNLRPYISEAMSQPAPTATLSNDGQDQVADLLHRSWKDKLVTGPAGETRK